LPQPGPGGRRVGPNGRPVVKRPRQRFPGNQFGKRREEGDEEIEDEEDYVYEDEVGDDYEDQEYTENDGQFYDTRFDEPVEDQ
jgi:hypothetical protein